MTSQIYDANLYVYTSEKWKDGMIISKRISKILKDKSRSQNVFAKKVKAKRREGVLWKKVQS